MVGGMAGGVVGGVLGGVVGGVLGGVVDGVLGGLLVEWCDLWSSGCVVGGVVCVRETEIDLDTTEERNKSRHLGICDEQSGRGSKQLGIYARWGTATHHSWRAKLFAR